MVCGGFESLWVGAVTFDYSTYKEYVEIEYIHCKPISENIPYPIPLKIATYKVFTSSFFYMKGNSHFII